jgi:nucleolar protein 56
LADSETHTQSSFIGRAGLKNKGRISRFLANKCSIASRIDCYTDTPSTAFGNALRDQVEERLAFYDTGANPTKNSEVMARVVEALRKEGGDGAEVDGDRPDEVALSKKEKKKSKKRKSEVANEEEDEGENETKKEKKKKRKSEAAGEEKKEKKSKKRVSSRLAYDTRLFFLCLLVLIWVD